MTRADTLVELGSGTSDKTRILLDALRDAGTITRFVPFDVSEQTLRDAAASVNREYPSVAVHAVVGDFEHHLGTIPDGGRRLVAFLGGTIGNLLPPLRAEFLLEIAKGLGPDDYLLLGLDLVKDVDRLEAAYDDGAGRHRRVQQERARGDEPRARRRLRRVAVRARRGVRAGHRADRDAARARSRRTPCTSTRSISTCRSRPARRCAPR